MAIIGNDSGKPLAVAGNQIQIPCEEVPSARIIEAVDRGVQHNLLIEVWGGLGDVVCAEPAIRYCLEYMPEYKVSLETWHPIVFRHLPITIFDTAKERGDKTKNLLLKSMYPADTLAFEFFRYPNMHRCDYFSIALFGHQMPMASKQIMLLPNEEEIAKVQEHAGCVVIHPGKTWKTRTLKPQFWDKVIAELLAVGIKPVIVGSEWKDGKRGTVAIDASQCIDLRDKLSIMEVTAILQGAKVVLTNDSAPLHIATSGNAWIGFFSTVNHPDMLMHWRNDGEKPHWAWRMKNFAKGWMTQTVDMGPGQNVSYDTHMISNSIYASWLPAPREVSKWAIEKFNEA